MVSEKTATVPLLDDGQDVSGHGAEARCKDCWWCRNLWD